MIVLYNLVLVAALVCASPLLLVAVVLRPRLRHGFAERLRPLDVASAGATAPRVWLHAASVGEVEAASPLIRGLLERDTPILATTLTVTGRDRLRALFPGLPVRLAPLDLPGLPAASARRARVGLLLLVETEIWPNLIAGAVSSGAAVLIASGRISDTSLRRYRLAAPFFRGLLRRVRGVAAQSEADAARFRELGVQAERVVVGGDLKLDRPVADPPDDALRAAIGPGPLLVGGSTHPGEEEALLSAWAPLRDTGLRLVLVPRHPERVPEICANLRRKRVDFRLRSEGAGGAGVVVVDSIGELAEIYALAELVFVGGTLAPIGGHNLFEPVRAGKLVVHGPHTENQRTQEQLLRPLGVLRRVQHARDLVETLTGLWADVDRNAAAVRAGTALDAHRGTVARALELIERARAERA